MGKVKSDAVRCDASERASKGRSVVFDFFETGQGTKERGKEKKKVRTEDSWLTPATQMS